MNRWFPTLSIVVLIAVCPCATAQNLVANGSFDTNIDGWNTTSSDLSAQWDATDRAGSPSSGSLLATNDALGYHNAGLVHCIDSIPDGEAYEYAGWATIPSGQTGQGRAYLLWYWYNSPGCVGSQTSTGILDWTTATDTWVPLHGGPLVAPPGTMSAWLVIAVEKQSPTPGIFQVYWDDLFYHDADLLFHDGFESGNLTGWSGGN